MPKCYRQTHEIEQNRTFFTRTVIKLGWWWNNKDTQSKLTIKSLNKYCIIRTYFIIIKCFIKQLK